MSAIQFNIRRIAMARRTVRELNALAAKRAAAARKRRAGVKFRLLSQREAEMIVGTNLIAALAASAQHT